MKSGTATRLADIYARSLLDLAKESRIVEAVAADLEVIADLLAQQPDLEAFLASPYFAEQTKRDLIRRHLHRQAQPPDGRFPVRHDRPQSRRAAAPDPRALPAAVPGVSGL